MTDTAETRIAAVLREHRFGYNPATARHECSCDGWCDSGPGRERVLHNYEEHVASVLVRELGECIPDRAFTDDRGQRWEWCGGEPGTWAWRVTAVHGVEPT